MIRLGNEVRDKVTGYTGIATARYEYLTGCIRYELQSRDLHEGKLRDSYVFDEGRLEVVGDGIQPDQVSAAATGGPHPTPAQPGAPRR